MRFWVCTGVRFCDVCVEFCCSIAFLNSTSVSSVDSGPLGYLTGVGRRLPTLAEASTERDLNGIRPLILGRSDRGPPGPGRRVPGQNLLWTFFNVTVTEIIYEFLPLIYSRRILIFMSSKGAPYRCKKEGLIRTSVHKR